MPDRRLEKLANVLVNYSTKVKLGKWVHITELVRTYDINRRIYGQN